MSWISSLVSSVIMSSFKFQSSKRMKSFSHSLMVLTVIYHEEKKDNIKYVSLIDLLECAY